MGQILVHNLDDEVIERLRAKALERGTSLEQFAREALTEVAGRPGRQGWIAELDAFRARTTPDAGWNAVEELRAAREELARRLDPDTLRRHDPARRDTP